MYTPEVLELLQHLDLVALLCAASLVRPPRPLLRVRRLGFLSLQKLSSIFQVSFEFAPQAVLGKWEAEQHTRWENREGRGGAGGGDSLVACLSYLAVDHASLSRRRTRKRAESWLLAV